MFSQTKTDTQPATTTSIREDTQLRWSECPIQHTIGYKLLSFNLREYIVVALLIYLILAKK